MRKLAIFAAAFALAAAVFVYLISDVRVLWFAGAFLVLSVLCRRFGFRRVSIAGLGVAVGFLWCLSYRQIWLNDVFSKDGEQQTVTVEVLDLPYETAYGAAVQCRYNGHQVVLYGEEALLCVMPGDRVSCTAKLNAQQSNLYFRSDGVVLTLYARDEIQITKGTPGIFAALRIRLRRSIETLYEGEAAGLLRALVIGDTSGLSYRTLNNLSVSGLRHAVAVSGLHISILLAAVSVLVGQQPRLTALLGIPLILTFVFVTGASASVCRSAIMNIMLLCAFLVRREHDGLTSLSAAALILLLQNPWCIADISFQLSFSAVLGLITLSGPIWKGLLRSVKKPGKVLVFVVSGVSATLAATVATLPLTLIYFGTLSVVAVITNLLALWAVTLVLTLGLASCMMGAVGKPLAWIVTCLCKHIFGVCDLAARFPYSAAYQQNMPYLCWAVAAYVLLSVALTFDRLPLKKIFAGMAAAFVVCVGTGRMTFMAAPWKLTVLDVGQGQCMVLRMGDYTAVIDCGGSRPEEAGEQAARVFHSAGLTHADALILSHYDDDHAGGMEQFLSRIQTDTVFLPAINQNETIVRAAEENAKQVLYVSQLYTITLPQGYLSILPPVSEENDNNAGITVLATAQEYDMLITGDLNADAEEMLVSQWELPDTDLLVAGHHGARSSTSWNLLQATAPEIVVISVGADNTYGHPHEETLERLNMIGAQVYRTDLDGTLYFTPERR